MSVELVGLLFKVGIFLWIAAMACLACVLGMHALVPKALLRTYFKEPYFSPAEIEFFTGFPFGYIRTVMFMRLAGFPKSGKKRGLTEAYKLAPRWFQIASKIILIALVTTTLPLIGLGLFFFFVL
jgi:hypothetical protein